MMAESRLAPSCETQGHVQQECSRNTAASLRDGCALQQRSEQVRILPRGVVVGHWK